MIELNITEHDWNQACAELTSKDIQAEHNRLVDEMIKLARQIDGQRGKVNYIIPGFLAMVDGKPIQKVYSKQDGEWKLIWENPNVGE